MIKWLTKLLNKKAKQIEDATAAKVVSRPQLKPQVILQGEAVELTGRWYVDGDGELYVECLIPRYGTFGSYQYPAFRPAGCVYEVHNCHG